MKGLALIAVFLVAVLPSIAQRHKDNAAAAPVANPEAVTELAKAVFNAHGGEKLQKMRTFVVRGSVDVTTSAFNQAIAGSFAVVISGDKYRIELTNPIQPFRQVFDGANTVSNVQNGFTLPPINRLGFLLLAKLGESGYVVSPLPEGKKQSGFRITSPEGWFTDFFVDDNTKLIRGYESMYEIGGRTVTTSVKIDKNRVVDGVVVPEKYSQRFDLGQLTAYADFKSKDILINGEVPNEIFSLAK